jgi:CRP-like cAMP-binding protein
MTTETSIPDESQLLDCLSDTERLYFEEMAYKRLYHKNSIIHAPGDQSTLIQYVVDGRVKIYNIAESGKEIIFRFCYSGSFFGLAEVCGGERREVYAEAMEDSHVLGLEREYFLKLIKGNPELAGVVFGILGKRLRQAHRAIQSLAIQDTSERLAYLLLKLSDMHRPCSGTTTVGHKLTHQEMANMIGATRSTVTELINYFKEKEYITYVDGIICIISPDQLNSIAAR